jgi:hypothetical protein
VMAHTCNPSYIGGKDQEDPILRSAWAKNETLSQTYPIHKRTGEVALAVE